MLLRMTDPFRTMDLLFDDVFGTRRTPRSTTESPPRVAVNASDDAFSLSVALPGLRSEDVQITAGPDWIQVTAERKVEAPEGYEARRRERAGLKIDRRIQLPELVDLEAVEASFDDGRLTVTLPKAVPAGPRTIAIGENRKQASPNPAENAA